MCEGLLGAIVGSGVIGGMVWVAVRHSVWRVTQAPLSREEKSEVNRIALVIWLVSLGFLVFRVYLG